MEKNAIELMHLTQHEILNLLMHREKAIQILVSRISMKSL